MLHPLLVTPFALRFQRKHGHELQSPGELFDQYADNQSACDVFTVFSFAPSICTNCCRQAPSCSGFLWYETIIAFNEASSLFPLPKMISFKIF